MRIVRTIKQDSVCQLEISFEHDLSPLVNVAILFLSVIRIPITEINHILVFHYYCNECTVMHNIRNTYPLLLTKLSSTMGHTKTVKKTGDISSQRLLKRLSRMHESGFSIRDISEQLELDQKSVNKLLKSLGYAVSST